MKISLKRFVKHLFYRLGFVIRKVESASEKKMRDRGTMAGALRQLKTLGVEPVGIIDVGAAFGSWTKLANGVWPNSYFSLIEPLAEQLKKFEQLKDSNLKATFYKCIAGEKEGEVQFSVTDDLDGSGVYADDSMNTETVKVIPIDNITKGQDGPFLLKLDTHGYEIPILNGALETLKKTDAMVIEVYGFHLSPTSVLFHELSTFLANHGFRLYDIVDVVRRGKDGAFWQADAVYLKSSHPIFLDNNYR